MRTPVVNQEQVLELLKDGYTTSELAVRFGVTRQAIDLYRRRYVKQGLLSGKRGVRGRARVPITGEQLTDVELRYIQELLGQRFQEAAKVPQLKARIEELEKELEACRQLELPIKSMA